MSLFIVVFIQDHCLFSWHKTNTMHEYRGYFRNQYPRSQSAGPKRINWPWRHAGLATWTIRRNSCDHWIYDHWRLKWFCVSCWHLITKLTIPRQSRMDTESCDIFLCLKLLIFDGAKWLQTWRWFAPKTQHRSKNKMADASFILDRAVWGKYLISFIF